MAGWQDGEIVRGRRPCAGHGTVRAAVGSERLFESGRFDPRHPAMAPSACGGSLTEGCAWTHAGASVSRRDRLVSRSGLGRRIGTGAGRRQLSFVHGQDVGAGDEAAQVAGAVHDRQ